MLNEYENEVKRLKEDILRICWYMRGGITYDEAIQLSKEERDIISKIIESNLDIANKNGIPFY